MKNFSFIMIVALMLLASCSSQRDVLIAFEKKGYNMGNFTPKQQSDAMPLLDEFPRYDADAFGYLPARNSVTLLYPMDEAKWSAYCFGLAESGFDCFEIGFVKADYDKGCTYNVSGRKVELYKKEYLLVTFAVVAL